MDAYEATGVLLSRIQSLDPENAAKIVGLLLIRDHGDEELLRLAFSSEALLRTVVAAARKELALLAPAPAAAAAAAADSSKNTDSSVTAAGSDASASSFVLDRQSSSSRSLGGGGPASPGMSCSPASWPLPPLFSRSGSRIVNGAPENLQNSLEELVSPSNPTVTHLYGAGAACGNYLTDEFHLQEQPSFVNTGASVSAHGPKSEPFYPQVPGDISGTGVHPYSAADWISLQRRRCSAADEYVGSETTEFGWKSCLYFSRGYCKHGPSCRFLHGLPDDVAPEAMPAFGKVENNAAADQQYEKMLLRSKSQRQLVASTLPYSPTASLSESPLSPNKCTNFLLHQQYDSQRAAAARMMKSNEGHKFLGQPGVMERSDFAAAMSDPGSRQIYLTFPADCTFKEEDVSNYFSIYGPVQDVRIPYQQKRMFGFVTFVYPETVKLILAKGNPHFVSDARVLVKPYKEKSKVPAKCRRQQQEADKSDIPGCLTRLGMESRYPFEFSQLGTRMSYNNDNGQEALLWRKLEEQQQAAEFQHVIELRSQQFMGLRLLDLNTRNHFNSNSTNSKTIISPTFGIVPPEHESCDTQKEDKNWNPAAVSTSEAAIAMPQLKTSQQSTVNSAASVNALEEEYISIGESVLEHNLPDSPFASSTKTSFFVESSISSTFPNEENMISAVATGNKGNNHHIRPDSVAFPLKPTLDIASFN